MDKIGGDLEQVHAWQKGLRHQRRIRGRRRRFHLHAMVSAQLQLALMRAVQIRHRSKSMIVEEALWRELGRLSSRDTAAVAQRLKYLDALVSEIIVSVRAINASKELANKREQEARGQRLNELAEKIRASINQMFDLVQTEPLAADERRAVMYRVLGRLAIVSATLLESAAGESTLAETDKLHQDQLAFEEVVKQLQDEAKEFTAEK